MKMLFSLLLSSFVFSSCINSIAPVDLGNELVAKKALSEKWELEYMETENLRNKIPEGMVIQIELSSNGDYISGVKNGKLTKKGTWDYDAGNHILTYTTPGGKFPSRIINLTQKELVIAEYTMLNDQIYDSTIFTYKKI